VLRLAVFGRFLAHDDDFQRFLKKSVSVSARRSFGRGQPDSEPPQLLDFFLQWPGPASDGVAGIETAASEISGVAGPAASIPKL